MLYYFILVIIVPFFFLCLPTRVIGKKFVKNIKNNSAIFSCNHQTMNDPIILKIRVNFKFKFIAKDSLFKNKLSNWFLRKLGAYPIKRGGNDIQAVKQTLTNLKENNHIVIFPEGTRVKEGESGEFKNGLALMALKSDCYVIPAVFRKRTRLFVFNTLLIGKPFKFSDIEKFRDVKPTKEILNEASEYLSNITNNLKTIKIKDYKKQVKKELLEFK